MSEKKVYSDGKIEKEIYDALGNEAAFHELYDKPGAVFHNFCQGRENLINLQVTYARIVKRLFLLKNHQTEQ